ncbi:histidine kinase [Streptomyces sp. SPB074]|uniref:histidine kinase n=1 Tax=Streptomyces sp. (strain SPB074) TaxID=465543 RepID=UPI00017F2056|nr:histidine kinase [Streptomyces sp. SPB074]
MTVTALLLALCPLLLAGGFLLGRRTAHPAGRSDLGTPVERATFETLHTASLAAPPLRAGLADLGEESARKALRRLRTLLGTEALCLTDEDRVVAWAGHGEHHAAHLPARLEDVLAHGRSAAFDCGCAPEAGCPSRWAVAAPVVVEDRVLGALVTYAPRESAVLARALDEVARWVSVQLELAELDNSRTRLIEAEIKALRAQISPHFLFNSLAAIASFVRTDPERARELLLRFADFARYSFRSHGDFTTLADELHSIDQYLALVRARFGERLSVTLQIAPEVLPVSLPYLCLQPLVENAVKHGLEGAVTRSRITIGARDAGAEAEVVIEDDGVGMDPERLRRVLRGEGGPGAGIGLLNVDERLRQVFGEDHGLVIETGVGAGTRITVRLPKYHPGVHSTPLPDRV